MLCETVVMCFAGIVRTRPARAASIVWYSGFLNIAFVSSSACFESSFAYQIGLRVDDRLPAIPDVRLSRRHALGDIGNERVLRELGHRDDPRRLDEIEEVL